MNNKKFIEVYNEDGTNNIYFSEFHFLNDKDEYVEKERATKIIIKELDKNKKIITESLLKK